MYQILYLYITSFALLWAFSSGNIQNILIHIVHIMKVTDFQHFHHNKYYFKNTLKLARI